MGGFFGAISSRDCVADVFFGVDYHTHLGAHRGGMASCSKEKGFERSIHNIESTPFRTKFEDEMSKMEGEMCIGCISDTDSQPLLIRSQLGSYALCTVGRINNIEELVVELLQNGHGHFQTVSGGKVNVTELVAALIDQKDSFEEGIRYAQERIDGSLCVLLMVENEYLIAARDLMGRLPVSIARGEDGYAVSIEPFASIKLGYEDVVELGPGEIARITADGVTQLMPPGKEMRICAFLWSYYGYPNSGYEGVNVEIMRNRNGVSMAKADRARGLAQNVDYICGVPDSGLAHAIGYANESHVPHARPFIKYTPTWPRSFMTTQPKLRSMVAKMKMLPVHELIDGKKLLLVDDSIVRGTQLQGTVNFLYENGAKEVHMRSACPPIMYGCKYLNFSTSRSEMDLIARRTIRELEGEEGDKYLEEYADLNTERGKKLCQTISDKLQFDSLAFQSLDELIKAIGIEPCKLCTYCWNGKE